ncbi:hypothetical protein KR032_001990 [Drosophila birchii]|nr:hypothetical protein KR032_001990 [Drosophila birchii]
MLFTYNELIDLAIGSPESGHVNFYALQVLLMCFARRLEVLDTVVEVQNSFFLGKDTDTEIRLLAGADAEEEAAKPAPDEEAPDAEGPVEEAPVEEAPVEEAPVEEVPVEEVPVEEVPVEEVPVEEVPVEEAPDEEEEEEPPPPPIEGETMPDKTNKDITEPGPDAPELAEMQDQIYPVRSSIYKESSVRSSTKKSQIDSATASNIIRLEKRVAFIEMSNEKASLDMEQFLSQFKVQITLIMEQLNHLAHILIDRKRDPHRIKVVRLFAKQLKALIDTEGGRELSISWSSDGADLDAYEEGFIENDFEEEEFSEDDERGSSSHRAVPVKGHMPIGFHRVYNDVVTLKTQVCALTNNVNELAEAMVKHDCNVLLGKFEEIQNTFQEFHNFKSNTLATTSQIMELVNGSVKKIQNLESAALLLDDRKSDKMEVELLMAEKVNFKQLATKVSLEQVEYFESKLDSMTCEIYKVISGNERNVLQIIDNLRMTLGIDAMEVGLKDFRKMVEERVGMIADALQRYMEMTKDECAAAAGRVKVMQDLACLSCDTTCLMRTVERQKVPSFPKAKASVGLAPAVAFDIGQIRGTGLMGYYRKDEYPCSTHAWTKGTSRVPLEKCNPRHAGGIHTTHTAEEHVQKVLHSRKNSGWM